VNSANQDFQLSAESSIPRLSDHFSRGTGAIFFQEGGGTRNSILVDSLSRTIRGNIKSNRKLAGSLITVQRDVTNREHHIDSDMIL